MNNLQFLQQSLSYSFQDENLLTRALTHPSLGAKNNQRLEFLGDAVLQLAVSKRLFYSYKEKQEGVLTRLRQQLVCENALAHAAQKIALDKYILVDKASEHAGVQRNNSVLADTMEAIFAAIYMDGGIEEAFKAIDLLITEVPTSKTDPKSALQEYLQAKKMDVPTYRTLKEEGPPHQRTFTIELLLCGKQIAVGTQQSKKKAEQMAAQIALNYLKEHACD